MQSLASTSKAASSIHRIANVIKPSPRLVHPTGYHNARRPMRLKVESEAATPAAQDDEDLRYEHLLVAIVDANPYLSGGSKQALCTASLLSKQHRGKITVLLVDEHKPPAEQEHQVMRDTVSWHLREHGCEEFDVIEHAPDSTSCSAVVGDLADEVGADLVLLSSEAVHGKRLDANLLAEFVSCPLLLLP